MLVILSEINCLDNIKRIGVNPDDFYTDFESFKSNIIFLTDATVVIIFAGGYAFRKRLIVEQYNLLKERAENPNDKGVSKVFVLSDATLPIIKEYYKFMNDFTKVYRFDKYKEKEEVNFWGYLRNISNKNVKTQIHLSAYDSGDPTEFIEKYNNRTSSEDEYIKLIIKPNLSSYKKIG